jgi:Protein of unknown function (DUF3349)
MYLADRVAKVVAFMRAGYPSAMPATGYVPAVALLPRRVTDDEINVITTEFVMRGHRQVSTADIGVAISRAINEMPSLGDIERVRHRLEAIGFRATA